MVFSACRGIINGTPFEMKVPDYGYMTMFRQYVSQFNKTFDAKVSVRTERRGDETWFYLESSKAVDPLHLIPKQLIRYLNGDWINPNDVEMVLGFLNQTIKNINEDYPARMPFTPDDDEPLI